MENFFDLPSNLDEELIKTILEKDNIRIEKIISKGQASPKDFWYDQDENEWLLLLDGNAEILFEDEKTKLKKGDTLFIPAHKKHRVEKTSENPPAIWLCVFWRQL